MAGRDSGSSSPRGRTSGSCPASAGGVHGAGAGLSVCLTHICSQGIQWTPVEFFDNSIICNLIENVSCPPSAWILGFLLPS